MTYRVLELFAGIGGLRCAWPEAEVVGAVDISQQARAIYLQNWHGSYHTREIAALKTRDLQGWSADVWWMSPPCQPYCRRGNKRDANDPRSAALHRVIDAIPHCLPRIIALENVPGFETSRCYRRLLTTLRESGYLCRPIHFCPTLLNWPNRRLRFYLLASLRSPGSHVLREQSMRDWQPRPTYQTRLQDLILPRLSSEEQVTVRLSTEDYSRFHSAVDRVVANHPDATTACFASSYGKTVVGAGSYLFTDSGLRRFTPREVARLLGFPDSFSLQGLNNRVGWRLLGNSLSLPAVRYVLAHLPDGPTDKLPWLS